MTDSNRLTDAAFDELRTLISLSCSGELDESQAQRLRELLNADEQARLYYLQYMDIHARLCWEYGRGLPSSDVPALGTATSRGDSGAETEAANARANASATAPTSSGEAANHPSSASRRVSSPSLPPLRTWYVLAFSTLAILLGCFAWWAVLGPSPEGAQAIATLTNTAHARWETPSDPIGIGSRFGAGKFLLREGIAELTFDNGSVVLLEGPAEIEVVDATGINLNSGRVFARVPEQARGFVINTPRASILDLGTAFGVATDYASSTLVQVFEGEVVAENHRDGQKHHFTAGRAFQIDRDQQQPREIEFAQQRFVVSLPDRASPENKGGLPYNKPQYDRIHIVPAPAGVTIDGDLSDWDQSGRFRSACLAPYGEAHFVEGCMMYDEQYLYIGANVGDPAPLRNILPPRMEGRDCIWWRGGSIQVRLSSSTELGWPLEGELLWPNKTRYGERPVDTSDNLVHLTMWYFQPEEQPCLHLAYGMDYHQPRINPAGFQGAFRAHEDGQGYVLEYAVPWSLLSAGEKPPRGGEEMAANWNVHWSDEGGRRWKGQLVEICNPARRGSYFASGEPYVWAATWGRAIYESQGKLPKGTVTPRR